MTTGKIVRRAMCLAGALWIASAGACSGDDSKGTPKGTPSECQKLCADMSARCGTAVSIADCQTAMCTIVPPAGCFDAVRAATCADYQVGFLTGTAAWVDICLPPCTTPTVTCNGNESATVCRDTNGQLRTVTVACATACSTMQMRYTGTCGRSYGSQTAATDQCWCM